MHRKLAMGGPSPSPTGAARARTGGAPETSGHGGRVEALRPTRGMPKSNAARSPRSERRRSRSRRSRSRRRSPPRRRPRRSRARAVRLTIRSSGRPPRRGRPGAPAGRPSRLRPRCGTRSGRPARTARLSTFDGRANSRPSRLDEQLRAAAAGPPPGDAPRVRDRAVVVDRERRRRRGTRRSSRRPCPRGAGPPRRSPRPGRSASPARGSAPRCTRPASCETAATRSARRARPALPAGQPAEQQLDELEVAVVVVGAREHEVRARAVARGHRQVRRALAHRAAHAVEEADVDVEPVRHRGREASGSAASPREASRRRRRAPRR